MSDIVSHLSPRNTLSGALDRAGDRATDVQPPDGLKFKQVSRARAGSLYMAFKDVRNMWPRALVGV